VKVSDVRRRNALRIAVEKEEKRYHGFSRKQASQSSPPYPVVIASNFFRVNPWQKKWQLLFPL
jgi:hypothetical protein